MATIYFVSMILCIIFFSVWYFDEEAVTAQDLGLAYIAALIPVLNTFGIIVLVSVWCRYGFPFQTKKVK